jgi:hypothetical protein
VRSAAGVAGRLGANPRPLHLTVASRLQRDRRSGPFTRALSRRRPKVLTHPRCVNCHPATYRPLQGNDQHPHQPMATRGETGTGTAANPAQPAIRNATSRLAIGSSGSLIMSAVSVRNAAASVTGATVPWASRRSAVAPDVLSALASLVATAGEPAQTRGK